MDAEDISFKTGLRIIYVDNDIIVLNKPRGLNTIPGNKLKSPNISSQSSTALPDGPPRRKRTHQEMWTDLIKDTATTSGSSPILDELGPDKGYLRPYLLQILESRGIVPRRRPVFLRWAARNLKGASDTIITEIFDFIKAQFESREGVRADSVMTRLVKLLPDVKTVHRLDCETSGLCVLACNLEAAQSLSKQFHDKLVEKVYIAILQGANVPFLQGKITLGIRSDPSIRPKQRLDLQAGKEAVTLYRVITVDENRNQTLAELKPLTGRTHQLRISTAALGHPILGDTIYSAEDKWIAASDIVEEYLDPWEGTGFSVDVVGLTTTAAAKQRLHLHAGVLAFQHPRTGKPMRFVAAPMFGECT